MMLGVLFDRQEAFGKLVHGIITRSLNVPGERLPLLFG